MTPDGFRKLALSFEGATEAAHQRHPDFRVNGRIFTSIPSILAARAWRYSASNDRRPVTSKRKFTNLPSAST